MSIDVENGVYARFLLQPLKKLAANYNYYRGTYRDVVWLIGDGRSGTTWLSGLINFNKQYRELFEPFHPTFVRDAKGIIPDQYVRQGADDKNMLALASKVFSGRLSTPRVDIANWRLRYSGLLVKDVLANLFAPWAHAQFPHIRIIFLIRNPLAVALSKYQTKTWAWQPDALDLLAQPHLYEDYLWRFEKLIRETTIRKDYFLNQLLRWSILNYIPLSQFTPDDIHLVFYEEAYSNPLAELNNIRRYINNGQPVHIDGDDVARIVGRPSRVTSRKSHDLLALDHLNRWQAHVTSEQHFAGMEILSAFGFADLYNENGQPCRFVAERLLSRPARTKSA